MPVMNNKNDLHGNRVAHGDDQSANQAGTGSTDSYAANRANKKEQEKEATKKALKTGAKGAATAFGSPAAGKAVDLASKTKLGDKILNKGAEALNRIPGVGKTMKKLDDKKVLDAADKAVDVASANPQNAAGGAAGAGANAAKGGATSGAGESVLDKPSKPSKPNFLGDNDDSDKETPSTFDGLFSGSMQAKLAIVTILFGGFFFFIIFFVVVAQGSGIVTSYDEAFGVSDATGGMTGGVDYETADSEAQDFFDRVADVKNSLQAHGKTFDAVYISAVYSVLTRRGAKLSYNDMTTGVITEIANAMFSGNSFSKETFKQNLIHNIFPKYLPNKSAKTYENMADEVFEYYDDYFSLIGATASSCASLGSCVYEIKGFYIKERGNVAKSMSITDLKVRLMQCSDQYGSGTWGEPLEGEELVPFEQYILGVAYQEIGPSAPDEAIKAQMVAARSYALARPTEMGNTYGKKLEQESNGQWILQMASCVADQVYCNPDLGCSAMNDGDQYGTVRSGLDHGVKFKDPMPSDHKMRTLANETMGEVLVNDQGYIVSAGYVQTEQDKFTELANQGLNYKQILLQVYNSGSRNYGASDIDKMNCNTGSGSGCNSTGSTGPYAGWKQGDPAWSTITIGNTSSTIGGVGCLVTSVSMLIAKSGVDVNVDGDFNPGTFVQKLNQIGGFDGSNFIWSSVSSVAPNFQFVAKTYVSGQSQQQKLSTLQGLLDQGYYVVAEVKGNTGQHWVAIDGIDGNNILMMDPASQSTSMWQQYNWANTSQYAYFKVV